MARLLVLGALVGCRAPAGACDGKSGACVAVGVSGAPERLDRLGVELTRDEQTRRFEAGAAGGEVVLPSEFALHLPSDTAGESLQLDVFGLRGGVVVSHGGVRSSSRASVQRVEVTLSPESRVQPADLSMSGDEGAALDGGTLLDGAALDGGALLDGALLDGCALTRLAVGTRHACALAGGQTWCWGENQVSQGGQPSTTSALVTPLRVPGLGPP